jgi:hypothetical protein
MGNDTTVTHPYMINMAARSMGTAGGTSPGPAMRTSVINENFFLIIPWTFPHIAQYSMDLLAVDDSEDVFGMEISIEQIGGGLTAISRGVLIFQLDQALLARDIALTYRDHTWDILA